MCTSLFHPQLSYRSRSILVPDKKKRPGYPVFTLEWLINPAHLYHTVSRREFSFSRDMAIRKRTISKHHLHHQAVGKYIV